MYLYSKLAHAGMIYGISGFVVVFTKQHGGVYADVPGCTMGKGMYRMPGRMWVHMGKRRVIIGAKNGCIQHVV